MFKIINNILERNLKYDGTTVLNYKINYPSIETNMPNIGTINFNIYNKKMALALQKKSENELYQEAVELYKYNKQNGYPKMIYEVDRDYTITLNSTNIISLYADEYIFSGGAHGTTARTSQNWNMILGRMIKLEEVFRNNPYFVLEILKEINKEIAENPQNYFEESCNLVIEKFNPESFYLSKDSVYIYYQQYDIAPYSSGIPTFKIKRP